MAIGHHSVEAGISPASCRRWGRAHRATSIARSTGHLDPRAPAGCFRPPSCPFARSGTGALLRPRICTAGAAVPGPAGRWTNQPTGRAGETEPLPSAAQARPLTNRSSWPSACVGGECSLVRHLEVVVASQTRGCSSACHPVMRRGAGVMASTSSGSAAAARPAAWARASRSGLTPAARRSRSSRSTTRIACPREPVARPRVMRRWRPYSPRPRASLDTPAVCMTAPPVARRNDIEKPPCLHTTELSAGKPLSPVAAAFFD